MANLGLSGGARNAKFKMQNPKLKYGRRRSENLAGAMTFLFFIHVPLPQVRLLRQQKASSILHFAFCILHSQTHRKTAI